MSGLGNQMANFVFLLKKKNNNNKRENMFILTSENYIPQTLSFFWGGALFLFLLNTLQNAIIK